MLQPTKIKWFLIIISLGLVLSLLALSHFHKESKISLKWPSFYTIHSVEEKGRLVVLSDGSRFIIPSHERKKSALWSKGDPIKLLKTKEGKLMIGHLKRQEKIEPLFSSSLPIRGQESLKIGSITEGRNEIVLRQGVRFCCRSIPHGWKKEMAVLILEEEGEVLKLYTPYLKDGLTVWPASESPNPLQKNSH